MRLPIFLLLLCMGLLLMAWQMNRPAAVPPTSPTDTGFAVVELFTSEGCSSCPPADRLLAQLATRADADNASIFALSFHVDYWNYLGWTDPYSDAAYSARQRAYSQVLGEGVYTPQIIVNGQEVFVGSNASKAQQALRKALAQPAAVLLSLDAKKTAADEIEVRFRADSLPADAVVHLALVERGLTQQVARGENTGRTLTHANVVRAFKTLPADVNTASLPLPADYVPDHTTLVAYAQHPATMQILGATRLDLHG